jgi:hypothetical protein
LRYEDIIIIIIIIIIKCIYKALFTSADVTKCLYRNSAENPKQQAMQKHGG